MQRGGPDPDRARFERPQGLDGADRPQLGEEAQAGLDGRRFPPVAEVDRESTGRREQMDDGARALMQAQQEHPGLLFPGDHIRAGARAGAGPPLPSDPPAGMSRSAPERPPLAGHGDRLWFRCRTAGRCRRIRPGRSRREVRLRHGAAGRAARRSGRNRNGWRRPSRPGVRVGNDRAPGSPGRRLRAPAWSVAHGAGRHRDRGRGCA